MQNKESFTIDFIGVGAAKSGTTWLSTCLSKHPQVNFVQHKEIQFFNKKGEIFDMRMNWPYEQGMQWYKDQFYPSKEGQLRGEFSPQYMADPDCADLIYKHFPNTKILVCLREPVARSYSHYWMFRGSFGYEEAATFENAIVTQPEYLTRSLYYPQLKRYYELFGKERIKVYLFEDIKNNPDKILADVCQFLNITDLSKELLEQMKNTANKNPTGKARSKLLAKMLWIPSIIRASEFSKYLVSLEKTNTYQFLKYIYNKVNIKPEKYPKISEETKSKLKIYFKEDILKTQELTGVDLSQWLES